MLCDRCKKNEATSHTVYVVNGEKTESHLCQSCRNEQQGIQDMNNSNLFSSLLGNMPRTEPLRCSLCGMEYSKFQQTGLLGCAQCYQDFREQLSPMLQRIHGRVQHQGHVPVSAGKALKARKRLEALQREMQDAVQIEDFERAAQLRDMLRSARKELAELQHPFGAEGIGDRERQSQALDEAPAEQKESARSEKTEKPRNKASNDEPEASKEDDA